MTPTKKKADNINDRTVAIIGVILGLVGTVIGIISIFYAREANQISKEANEISKSQLIPKMTVLWIQPSWWKTLHAVNGDVTQTGCDNTIRLYNSGGVPATITGHVTEITYHDSTIQLAATTYVAQTQHDLLKNNDINLAESFFLTTESQLKQANSESADWEYFSDLGGITFPMQVDAYTATDVVNRVILTLMETLDVRDASAGDPRSYRYDPNILKTYSPLEVTLNLTLATGETVTTPKITCIYLKKK